MTAEVIVMATADGQTGHTLLDAALDIFRMRQYFNVVTRAREVAGHPRSRGGGRHRQRRGLPRHGPARHAAVAVRPPPRTRPGLRAVGRLRRQARTLLVEPVPYGKVAGTGFYKQFLDTGEWPRFMRAGREAPLAALRENAPRAAAV
jgi:hypothetical protein